MFLHLLNDQQQTAFLALAQQFIEADSHLADAERNLLELMYAETGQSFDVELPEAEIDALLPVFDTRQAKAAVLLELLGVGHADAEFHPEENVLLERIASGMGVSQEQLEAMDRWVQRQLELAREVEQFWAEPQS